MKADTVAFADVANRLYNKDKKHQDYDDLYLFVKKVYNISKKGPVGRQIFDTKDFYPLLAEEIDIWLEKSTIWDVHRKLDLINKRLFESFAVAN